MPNQISVHVARERNKILRDLAAEKKLAFMRGFLGNTVQAITLGSSQALSSRPELPVPQGTGSGVEGPAVFAQVPFTETLTDNYQKLYLKGLHAPNQWLVVRVETVSDSALIGSAS
jgi:tRNA A37 methylthiotransferase MiaB